MLQSFYENFDITEDVPVDKLLTDWDKYCHTVHEGDFIEVTNNNDEKQWSWYSVAAYRDGVCYFHILDKDVFMLKGKFVLTMLEKGFTFNINRIKSVRFDNEAFVFGWVVHQDSETKNVKVRVSEVLVLDFTAQQVRGMSPLNPRGDVDFYRLVKPEIKKGLQGLLDTAFKHMQQKAQSVPGGSVSTSLNSTPSGGIVPPGPPTSSSGLVPKQNGFPVNIQGGFPSFKFPVLKPPSNFPSP